MAMGRVRARLAAVAVVGAFVTPVALGAGAAAGASSGKGELARQMAEVRQATAKYHDLAVALADGYVPFGEAPCVAEPTLGAMGFHYYNPALLHDGVLDPLRPELLVYAPSDNGVRLGAVEYMMPLSTWNSTEPPDLFGKPFDGPMPEHEPNTSGIHYDQHAWVWAHNPEGVLATWNPSVEC
jgi:hypothetical protein